MLSRASAVVRYGGHRHEYIPPWTNVTYIPNYPLIEDFTNSTAHSEHQTYQEAGGLGAGQQRNRMVSLGANDLPYPTTYDNMTRAGGGGMLQRSGPAAGGGGSMFGRLNGSTDGWSPLGPGSPRKQPLNYTEPQYYLGKWRVACRPVDDVTKRHQRGRQNSLSPPLCRVLIVLLRFVLFPQAI